MCDDRQRPAKPVAIMLGQHKIVVPNSSRGMVKNEFGGILVDFALINNAGLSSEASQYADKQEGCVQRGTDLIAFRHPTLSALRYRRVGLRFARALPTIHQKCIGQHIPLFPPLQTPQRRARRSPDLAVF